MNTARAQVGWRFWLVWVFASIVGLAVGSAAGGFVGLVVAFAGTDFGGVVGGAVVFAVSGAVAVEEAVAFAMAFAVSGASLGIAQWLVLRRHISRPGWWVLASTVGMAVGGAVGMSVGVGLAVGVAVGFAIYGAITGGVLVWLLRKPMIEEPSLPQDAAQLAADRPIGAVTASEIVPDSQLAEDNTPYYFPVSNTKLILMGFATLGFYELYWFYKNWVIVKEREKSNISPFWRTVFIIFFIYPLFKKIDGSASFLQPHRFFNPGWTATAWIGFSLAGLLLPAPISYLSFFSVFILSTVQTIVNQINSQASPAHDPNDKFSLANYLILVLAGIWFLLILVG